MRSILSDYLIVSATILLVCSMSVTVHGQILQPVYQAAFDNNALEEDGWNFFKSGPDYDLASVSTGVIPLSPVSEGFSNGQGAIITAAPGQGSFVYGPVIPVGKHLALLRLSVLSVAKGGSIAVGALNASPGGSIVNVNGSVTYAYESDSGRFMGDYQYIHVLYRPEGEAIIPIFQLAVAPAADQTAVTAMFDNFEVFLLNEETVSDPAMRQVLGIDINPGATPTPTTTPVIAATPTPDITVEGITVGSVVELSNTNDQQDVYSPQTKYDRNDNFSVVAVDLTGGFQDIAIRNINTDSMQIDGPFTVNEGFEDTVSQAPDMDIDFGGLRHIVWSDNRSVEKLFSIYLTQIDSFGERRVIEDVEINSLFENTNTAEPSISVLSDNDLVICWRDDRNLFMDVFAKRLHWTGSLIEANEEYDFQLNIPFENTNVSHPDITANMDGDIVAVWSDDRVLHEGRKRNDVYARIFAKTTQYNEDHQLPEQVKEIQISGNDNYFDHAREPKIAYINEKFVIVWRNSDPTVGESSIYAAVINDQGDILEEEFIIASGEEFHQLIAPSIAPWKDGQLMITWYDETSSQVFGRVYDAEYHLFIGDAVPLVDNVASSQRTSVAMGDENTGFVSWDGVTRGFNDIFGASLFAEFDNGVASIPTNAQMKKGALAPQGLSVMSVENNRRSITTKAERQRVLYSATR